MIVVVVDALVTTVFVGGVAAMDGIAPAWCLWLDVWLLWFMEMDNTRSPRSRATSYTRM